MYIIPETVTVAVTAESFMAGSTSEVANCSTSGASTETDCLSRSNSFWGDED